MKEHNFMLLFAGALAYCSPVIARQGGNGSAHLFFCNIPGCVSVVTKVFCNDIALFSGGPITNCTGPPRHNNVCQHNGLAFISADTDAHCDFEGKDGQIKSEKCTENSSICASLTKNSSICASLTNHSSIPPSVTANTPSPDKVSTRNHYGIIAAVCTLLLLLTVVIAICVYRRSQQQRARNSPQNAAVIVPLRPMQDPGEIRE